MQARKIEHAWSEIFKIEHAWSQIFEIEHAWSQIFEKFSTYGRNYGLKWSIKASRRRISTAYSIIAPYIEKILRFY